MNRKIKIICNIAIVGIFFPLSISLGQSKSQILDYNGNTGATNYITLPFFSDFMIDHPAASPFLAPGNLFWSSGSYFTNPANMAVVKAFSASQIAKGLVPFSGSQLWVDSYEVSQPASLFPNEPSNISQDRANNCCSTGEFQAWVKWVQARPNLQIMANDGGSMPVQFRAWSSTWGHVSPLMPLQNSDCPPDMSTCTYGDWYAYRWGQTAGLTGAPAISLSDFSDSQPYAYSTQEGFNPEIISAFSINKNIQVPSGNVSSQSVWINTNAIVPWNDYLAMGYGKFFGALASRIGSATGQPSLVLDQCDYWPSVRRFFGIDPRILVNYISPKNYLCIWDEQTIQLGRTGQDPVMGLGGYAMAAARDPSIRNGANLEANDPAYWQAIASFYPNLSAADQNERGLKILKRLWLEAGWAHIATQTGAVRRALAYMSRDYFDLGTIDPIVQKLIQTIYPNKPFGFGIYYSVSAERSIEQQWWGQPWAAYYPAPEFLALKQSGVPVNYYVSDAAINNLSSNAAPSAWILMDNSQAVPKSELNLLNSISHNRVFTSIQQALAFSGAPLKFSNGLTGTGFFDQNNRLIVTVTNINDTDTAGFIELQGIANGAYNMLDLFTNQTSIVNVAHGGVNIPVTVTRWDTRAFALSQ